MLAVLGAGVFIVVAIAAADDTPRPAVVTPKSTFTLQAASTFADFPVYNAGTTTVGVPLVAVLRRNDRPTNYVSFIYGSCEVTSDTGCAPPAEIQTWAACSRNPSFYKGPQSVKAEATTVRGVPAAFFEDGRRLEIQTGSSTVVIFARSSSEALTIAAALVGVNNLVEKGNLLPPPTPGALTGNLNCS
ncbi:MAG: hypothetical protein WKF65_09760 [Gaiellaceae bacterium]